MALRLIRDRPGDRLSCHHHQLEALASRQLDASTGASDPNDFAVRNDPSSPKGYAGHWRVRPRAAASTAPRPTFVTMANAPLLGTGWLEL